MWRAFVFCAALLCCATTEILAAGLDLTWNACSRSALARGEVQLDCDAPDGSALLVGCLSTPVAVPGLVGVQIQLDFALETTGLPAFWHFESGGCNADGAVPSVSRSILRSVPGRCPDDRNPTAWASENPQALITSVYVADFNGGQCPRLVLDISQQPERASDLAPDVSYYLFDLTFSMANARQAGGGCDGCEAPGLIAWEYVKLYLRTGYPLFVEGPGSFASTACFNGGFCGIADPAPARCAPTPVRNQTWGQIKAL